MAPETRSRSPYPNDRTRVSLAMRKRRMMAIKRNKIDGFWEGSVYIPDGESLPENTNDVIQDVWWRQVVSNGKLALRPARQRKQPAKAKPCKDTKPAPRVTGRRGRDNVCTDEPAIGFRNAAPLDACADNAVRGVDSIDGHISDNGNGNGNGNGIGDDP
ncbi:regulated by snt2 1 [Fusarium beomiforme]|uniref:Regulated by snt2 1 n=1 Tax=Fusarium beomiforme TaxID=44412 RepID=A0A9P5A442_9HYPO|nr:regulated by snt2 1 [Fusarium beomiforme]